MGTVTRAVGIAALLVGSTRPAAADPVADWIDRAVASVLAAVFGDTVPTFTLSSPTAPRVTRSFTRLSDYAAEVTNARIYDGVHYRTSGNVGAAMGRQIGVYVAENLLTPLR